jgi:hypothetical protein
VRGREERNRIKKKTTQRLLEGRKEKLKQGNTGALS